MIDWLNILYKQLAQEKHLDCAVQTHGLLGSKLKNTLLLWLVYIGVLWQKENTDDLHFYSDIISRIGSTYMGHMAHTVGSHGYLVLT